MSNITPRYVDGLKDASLLGDIGKDRARKERLRASHFVSWQKMNHSH